MSAPENPNVNRQELEDEWQERLHEAQKRYHEATARSNEALRVFRERSVPTPDGGEGYNRALREETLARREYMRVLRIFTDLTVAGTIPEE